eukprot:m.77336 g.77336  ORF g.77336 m.77336 type:complete len:54 (-) comp19106_c0_seq1:610-771(-)
MLRINSSNLRVDRVQRCLGKPAAPRLPNVHDLGSSLWVRVIKFKKHASNTLLE